MRAVLEARGNTLLIRTPFHPTIKDGLKALPTATWNKAARAWSYTITPATAPEIRAGLEALGLDVSGDVKALYPEEASNERLDTLEHTKGPPPWPHQIEAAFRISQYGSYIHGGMGVGKAVEISTPVVTPQGICHAGQIQPGDEVISPTTGCATEVLGVFPQGRLPIFKVLFTDGTSTRCSADHLWAVQTAHDRHAGRDFKVKPLRELEPVKQANGNSNHFIPMTRPVTFEPGPLPIDPYALGLLLGDGGFTHGVPGFYKDEPDLVRALAKALPEGMAMRPIPDRCGCLLVDPDRRNNRLTDILRDLGLWGLHSPDKFIPDIYLLASPKDRLRLLQGLIDTDGDVSPSGKNTTSNTSSTRLKDGIVFLIQSLGGIAPWHSRIPKYTHKGEKRLGKRAYRVNVSLPPGLCPVSSQKHLARWKAAEKYHPVRAIAAIEPVGEAECVCFKVAEPDGLFMVNDFIVTHNTRSVVDAAVNYDLRRVLVLCPSSVVTVWPKEFAKYAARPVRVIALSKKKTVPARTEHVRRVLAAADAAPHSDIHVVVINYEAAWREPFASWALEREWDLVVLDEIHRGKSDKGKASKFCAKLRGSAKRVTGMSGTPMPHGPLDIFAQYRAIEPGIFGTSMTRFKIRYGSDVQFAMESDASPPADRLQVILSNSEESAEIWSGERDFDKPFNRDLAITFRLMNASWADQEIVNALIAHRRKLGKAPMSRGHYIAVLATAKKKKGYPVSKYSNLEELREKMDRIRLYIDRDVLDLPDAMSVVKHVTLSAKEERVHKELERDLVSEIEAGRITAKNALTKLLKLQQAICGWAKPDEGDAVRLGTSRQEVLTEILEDCGCPGGEAAVVFCRFHADLNAVHEAASALGVRSAELSGRVNELEEWQADGGPEVLAVQIQAGGLGVDLTRARYSIFYSIDYSLGTLEQAYARTHRPGQTKKVTHIHLVAPGTVDEHVYEAVQQKKDIVEFVIKTLGGE